MSFLYVTVENAILIASMTADFPELFSPIIAFTPLLNCKVTPSSSKVLKFFIVSFFIYILSTSLSENITDKTEIYLSPD